ncbi:MAG: helix-hairpin-helix domain-containing protein [Myxococcota bacterium]|nr:helix-hairpin-helix domain-containing protein [Myxococcota bacterium]
MFQALFFFSTLMGCQTNPISDSKIHLQWTEGQRFHLASTTQHIAVKDSTELDSFGGTNDLMTEVWTQENIWTYQVIEHEVYPDSSDELYEYSIGASGRQLPISVIKVTLDPILNIDNPTLELEPVIYLVLRSRRNRLAGVIQYLTENGERTSSSWSASKLGRSRSLLAESQLPLAPTVLAPFGVPWESSETRLDDGSTASTYQVDGDTTDVVFEGGMGGELMTMRYMAGQPWPTWIETASMSARLLTDQELDDQLGFAPPSPEAPENFDYKAALQRSIDLDDAMNIIDQIAEEGFEASVAEKYRPWAGAWWPLKGGELVLGYKEGQESLSQLIEKEWQDEMKERDELSQSIHDMEDSSEKDEKINRYHELKSEIKNAVNEFYTQLMRDLDGGKIKIQDGTISHTEDDWSYKLDDLSPMDKWSVVEYLNGHNRSEPFSVSKWELLNSYRPGGDTWWGHCNGWAAAAILTNEPTESVTVTAGSEEINFSTGDIKGLLTESHYGVYAQFYGERYNGEEQDISDLSPAHFHKLITFYLKEQGIPFVFDTTASEAVWNFPTWKAKVAIENTGEKYDESLIQINTADLELLQTLSTVNESDAQNIINWREDNGAFQDKEDLKNVLSWWDYFWIRNKVTVTPNERTLEVVAEITFTTDSVDATHIDGLNEPESFTEKWGYTLKTDGVGNILEGTWEDENEHPDFAWVPYKNAISTEYGGGENEYLHYSRLLEALGGDIERE